MQSETKVPIETVTTYRVTLRTQTWARNSMRTLCFICLM